MDSNHSGKINTREFYLSLREMDMDVDRQDAEDVVNHFDLTGANHYDEFLVICGASGKQTKQGQR